MIVCIIVFVVLIWLVRQNKKGKFLRVLDSKETKYFFLILIVSNSLALLLFVSELYEQYSRNEIIRNAYGEGSRKETYEVTLEGELEKEPFTVEIGEQEYSQTETRKMFEQVMDKLDEVILNENESLDKVEHDLNLVTTLEGYPVSIKWEFDRYDVLNTEGEILESHNEEEGVLVEIRGIISYIEEEAIYVTHVIVFPEVKTGKEKWLDEIAQLIKEEERSTREEESFSLPESIAGKELQWSKETESTGYYILILGTAAAFCIPLKTVQNKREEQKKRQEQMMRDYPEIISKFVLLLSTGMTLKNVWTKVVQTYEEQRNDMGMREAYEEMCITYREMQGGIPEKEAYERFGQRCGMVPYMKFAALLSQNLKKGSKGLTELLKVESIQAFENRKSNAKKLGEEASTKLLLPMFGMLAVVLIMIVVPAFLTMQL